MAIADDIVNEESNISNLRGRLRQIKIPRRTITWQHNNIGGNVRNISRRILIARKERRQINSQIASSQNRVISLRESILGKE